MIGKNVIKYDNLFNYDEKLPGVSPVSEFVKGNKVYDFNNKKLIDCN